MTGDRPIVRGRDIRKTFRRDTGETVTALSGVSLEAAPGTLTALVGPDGAGKTTLLRCVAGLLRLDGGDLVVVGLDIRQEAQQVQKRIGYMPQKFGLYEDLTVRENLDLYADMHGIASGERGERYPRLMEMTALGPFQKRLAGQLSGGMKQKLGLACTLVREPELLLLDEPTVGVDPLSRRELWDIILQLVREQGLAVLLSTAYLGEAERCERVVVLHEGKVLAHGPAGGRARSCDRPNLPARSAGRSTRSSPPGGLARPTGRCRCGAARRSSPPGIEGCERRHTAVDTGRRRDRADAAAVRRRLHGPVSAYRWPASCRRGLVFGTFGGRAPARK